MSIVNVNKHGSVKIVEPVNLYGCTLNENVFVGPFVEIQSNVIVGKNTRFKVTHLFVQM